MDEIIKVHIWQLPEKIDDIDKLINYSIIDDGSVKKVKIEKLYEYFNQDYKVENINNYFEESMDSINKEYNPQYFSLEIALKDYEILVQELVEKFKMTRNKIRKVQTILTSSIQDTNDIEGVFEDTDNKLSILLLTLNNFSDIVLKLKTIINTNSKDIESLNDSVNKLIENTEALIEDSSNMKTKIENNKINEDVYINNRKGTLINKINSEYDKILAIIDYYHHIHDNDV